VVVVPLALSLEAPVPPDQIAAAERRLARARAIGEEYEGVRVSTKFVRGRDAGEAIVAEARAQGVEAIIMAVEEPTQIKGGALFGGKESLREMFVGETTRHVVNKAPCRVILTAPP
jgi:APA family basic amino acid/polyamine antiporter